MQNDKINMLPVLIHNVIYAKGSINKSASTQGATMDEETVPLRKHMGTTAPVPACPQPYSNSFHIALDSGGGPANGCSLGMERE